MIPSRYIKYNICGALVGYVAWGHSQWLTIVSIFLFLAYLKSEKRLEIFLFSFAYYLLAARGLVIGVTTYYDDKILYGLAIWIGSSLISSMVWSFIWTKDKRWRFFLLLISIIISIIPPIGFLSWVNPIVVSGYIYPDSGYFGIIGLLLFLYFLSSNVVPKIPIITVQLFISFYINVSYQQTYSDSNIKSISSHYYYSNNEFDYKSSYTRQISYINQINASKSKNILLPENALGYVNRSLMMLWKNLDKNKTGLAGAHINIGDGKLDNVLLEINHTNYSLLYKQRVPVPISMWKPWSNTGVNAHPFENPSILYQGKKISIFICYEQLLSYTFLHSFWYNPDEIWALSNLWWSRGTTINTIQEELLWLWGRLFNIPIIIATNT